KFILHFASRESKHEAITMDKSAFPPQWGETYLEQDGENEEADDDCLSSLSVESTLDDLSYQASWKEAQPEQPVGHEDEQEKKIQ
ncbi:hypothetical protein MBANPS3_012335, partial [Mucor bainieri]